MKTRLFLFFASLLLVCWSTISCNCNKKCNQVLEDEKTKTEVILQDFGAEPTVLNIDEYTMANDNFRIALWTGTMFQVTLMSIPVGGEIGLELHSDVDQFLRIEGGQGRVFMGDTEDSLTFEESVEADFAIFVPAGKWHNIINTGDKPLKLYSIYSPVEHPHGTVHKTFEESEEAEH